MATLTGVRGSVTFGGTDPVLNVNEWTADTRHDVFDDSDFNDSTNARTKVGGMSDLVGVARGTAVVGTLPVITDLLTEHDVAQSGWLLESSVDTGFAYSYSFSGIITSIKVVEKMTDRVRVEVAFESAGEVTIA